MNKTKKAIIFGTGNFARLAFMYLENDSEYEIVCFCETVIVNEEFCNKPVVSFSYIENIYPPNEYEMFVAVAYRKMNDLRKDFCQMAIDKGYNLLSYVSSKSNYWKDTNTIGNNVFIFENNNLQPFVKIGDGVIMWSGNHIGHHSEISEYSFLTSHVVVSGYCVIGAQCFLGVNSTIVDNIKIGRKVLVGAGVLVTKSISDGQVIVRHKDEILEKSSDYFLR